MNKFAPSFLASLLLVALPACDRREVTSTEAPDSRDAAVSPSGASAAGPDGGLPPGVLAEEKAKFEAWAKKYNLDPKDPGMMDADSDGDGYSNREEFLAGTNPRDPISMPGLVDGVSMKELKDVRVPMILREVKGGRARVERIDAPGQEELHEGSQPKGLPYRVTSIKQQVKADKHGVFTDVSQVTLENPGTKEIVVLIRDLPARSSETHAVITGPGGEEQKLHVDEVVTLPGIKDKKYKVLELRPDQVVVEEIGTRRPLTIPKR